METINFHFTDKCNYKCYFCFVNKNQRELTFEQAKLLVDKCERYFKQINKTGRINLAGGEPMCCSYLQQLIDYIHSKGIIVSMITNGSLLSDEFIIHNRNKLYMIGISVDSLNKDTNINLGRCNNKTIDYNDLIHYCKLIKENSIKLKINTCVSKVNLNESIIDFLELVKPDRIKFLQVLPSNKFGYDNSITDFEFKDYLKQYEGIKYVNEDNEFMKESYLIIDSEGNLSKDNLHNTKLCLLDNYEINDLIKQL